MHAVRAYVYFIEDLPENRFKRQRLYINFVLILNYDSKYSSQYSMLSIKYKLFNIPIQFPFPLNVENTLMFTGPAARVALCMCPQMENSYLSSVLQQS